MLCVTVQRVAPSSLILLARPFSLARYVLTLSSQIASSLVCTHIRAPFVQ
jgi:hypothetical protein